MAQSRYTEKDLRQLASWALADYKKTRTDKKKCKISSWEIVLDSEGHSTHQTMIEVRHDESTSEIVCRNTAI